MKKYYCVTSAYYDSGRVTAAIVDEKQAEQKPDNDYISLRDRDVYIEWFESLAEAKNHVLEARKA